MANWVMRRGWAWATLATVVLLPCGCERKAGDGAERPVGEARPNIVLISVDTLRADHLSCYGYERATSPRIDQLAAEGALFEEAISSTSWTLPAHAALFTGLADSVHGCLDDNQRLDGRRVTLAEHLKGAGYQTVGFFSGPFLHPVFGLSQGFDEYVDCTSFAEWSSERTSSGQPLVEGGGAMLRAAADVTNPTVYGRVRDWLRTGHRRPFFMFIHMWDVHADYIPPPPYDRQFDPDYEGPVTGRNVFFDKSINAQMPARDIAHLVALYDGEIAWTDYHVGMIMDELDALKLRDSTIVVLLSDHGEEFFEHGGKDHRRTLYDEVIHIPLIIRMPGRVPAGGRFSEQVRMIDVLPTILELANVTPSKAIMGQSLVPLFEGEKLPDDTLAVSELYSVGRKLRSFRRNEYKLIFDEQRQRGLVFDMLADPGEKTVLDDPDNAKVRLALGDVRQGLKWLGDFVKIVGAADGTSPELPDSLRQHLKTLGYIGGSDEDEKQP